MKDNKNLISAILLIVFTVALIVVFMFLGNKKGISIETQEDAKKLFNSIYDELGDTLPSLDFVENINSSTEAYKSYNGLSSQDNVEFMVVSEPIMSSQAYSAVILKVKDKSKIEDMKQEIYDNINMRKWLCVEADRLYITSSNDIIFFVMAYEEWATPVYNTFKKHVNNNISKELEKINSFDLELPDEIVAY